jgi:nucleotide-binding universal stress UspA family protein
MTKISIWSDKSCVLKAFEACMFADENSFMARKTILCAIDFSESSLQALRWSMREAQLHKAQVTFLYCYRLIADGDEGESLNMKREMETKAIDQFHKIESELIDKPTVPYQFVTEIGFFPSRIEMFVRKSPVSLLVMGNSIIENFNEYKNLSFDQFLHTTKVPVVIAPEPGSTL